MIWYDMVWYDLTWCSMTWHGVFLSFLPGRTTHPYRVPTISYPLVLLFRVYACMYGWMDGCMYAWMHVHELSLFPLFLCTPIPFMYSCICVCIHAYDYVFMYFY